MTVTRSDDRNNPTCAAGDCSLREALTAANASADVNTIQFSTLFDTPQVISLTNGQLTISTSVSIIGKGANLTTVSANGAPRVFYIGGSNANITISGLTIADGDTGNESDGGGIWNQGNGTVNLIDCAFTNNRSTVYGSAISRGTGGTWNIIGCTFSGNNAFLGTVLITGGITNITNTTISGNNTRGSSGGSVFNNGGTLTITSSTITGNSGGGVGGGVWTNGPATLKNSIIAVNNGNLDVYRSASTGPVSGGYNFIGKSDGTDGFTNGVNNDQVGTAASPKDPLLLPLANNGGRTLTHALLNGSPAIDKGFSFGSTADQRGFIRPVDLAAYANAPGGDGTDIGAVESGQPLTYTVTRIDDRNNATCAVGDCSLREAITASNASFTQNVIQFSAVFDSPQTVVLTNGELTIGKSLSIIGKGANLTTISGNNASRVFFIPQSLLYVTISGLTIANGNGNGNGSSNGGGLNNLSTGVVNLTNCAFTNNTASSGYGGGIEDRSPGGGSLNITGCTFSGNSANEGGAIKIQSNVVNVTNTTISGNTGNNYGGGIANYDGSLTLTNSTITGNTSSGAGSGGGLVNIPFGVGTATVKNSIIAGNNGVKPDVGGSFTSNGYNLIGKSDGSSGFTDGVNNDQAGTIASPIDPLLLPLANNGGTTMTHALAGGSPAIDNGSTGGPGTDQRGSTRPIDSAAYSNAPGGNGSDIGAYEAQAPTPVPDLTVTKTHTGSFIQGDTGKTYTITVANSGGAATSGNVSVVDTLPVGLTATAITGPGWTCTLGTLTCTRNDVLSAGASYPVITLTVSVAANAPALVTNIATVSGGGEFNTRNNKASDPATVATSDLTVTKTHTGSFIQGDTGKTYTITVKNSGVAATSGSVSVVDTLPAGLTATAIAGTGWTCTLGTVSCTRSDVLAAAASYPAITLTVNVSAGAPALVTNIVTVSGGGESNTGNNQASDPTTIVPLTLIVTRVDDRNNPACVAGDCSLREAVNTANTSADIKAIQFSAVFDSPQTITLTNGQIAINQSMSIIGKGANLTTVSGGNATRIFLIAQNLSNVTISGLTMANGSGGNGAGLQNLSTGVVNLTNCAFINNIANFAYGGGIEDHSPGGGSLNITGCTFSGNVANEGGAIKIQSNVVNVTNTTISGNTGNNHGGGIANYSGTLTLTSSTITGNTTNGAGSAGGLVNISAGAISTVRNSIISGNAGANPDVSGSFTSGGYNFIGKSNGSTGFGVNNDQVGTIASPKDPLLLPLANNGGKTRTHALSVGSPAIDKGFRFGFTTDQRGLLRPFDNLAIANAPGGDGSDIGAFEAQLTVVTTSNFNPSAWGQTVVFTATVLTPGATATGTVTFNDGATALCSAVALSSGQATCISGALAVGSHNMTAVYSGDGNNAGSTSPILAQVVNKANTTTLIGSHTPNPSTVGSPIAVAATVSVTPPGAGTPGGTITVSDGTANCVITLPAASCNLTPTSSGTKTLTAIYSGNGSFNGSTSSGLSHTVQAVTTTSLGSAQNPSVFGQSLTFTSTVTGATPTGTVTFNDGATALCSAVALSSGQATCISGALAVGSHNMTAVYSGDGNNAGSTSSILAQVVIKANTTTLIGSHTPNPSAVGSPIAVAATVSVTAPGAGTPGGTITVSDGTANCVITLPAASCNLTPTSTGAKTLTATYGGNGSFNNSTSAGVSHTVLGTLDIDASNTQTKYDAQTDGVLIVRYLVGFTGNSLVAGALGATATRTDPAAIKSYLDSIRPLLDVDGNGSVDALTDGLLIMRHLLGLSGNALISGALAVPPGARTTAPEIQTYIQSLMP
ncbi:MAG: Ig-like domain repeat protein [Casimicrobium sp.]